MKKLILLLTAATACYAQSVQSSPVTINASDPIVGTSLPEINSNFTLLGGRLVYGSGAPIANCATANDIPRIYVRNDAGGSAQPVYTCQLVSSVPTWVLLPSSASVTSVFGRVGVVAAASGDYTAAQVGALSIANNLSDLANAATARTNLGLGSIATSSSSAFLADSGSNGIVKRTGAGITTAATAGTDYAPATSGSAPLKGNGAGGTAASLASDIVGLFSTCSGTQYLGADGACHSAAGSGTVTSVGLTMPSIFSVAGSPITTSGTLAVTAANQNANLVYAGPSSGGAAAPAFRALVAGDIPSAFVQAGTLSLGTTLGGSVTATDSTASPVSVFTGTQTAAITTLTFSGFQTGKTYTFRIKQGTTGGWGISGAANVVGLPYWVTLSGTTNYFTGQWDGTNLNVNASGNDSGYGCSPAGVVPNAAPSSGFTSWLDPTDNLPHGANSASTFSSGSPSSGIPTWVIGLASPGSDHKWVSYVDIHGNANRTQPASTDLSDTASVVRNNQANTFTGGALQDFSAVRLRATVNATDPGTCSQGELEVTTAGATKTCTAANTWTQLSAASGGDTITSPGSTLSVGGTSTNTTLDVASHAVTSAQLAVVQTRRTCNIVVGSDDGSALVGTNLGPQGSMCFIPAAATVQEVTVRANAGTPNVIAGRDRAGTVVNLLSAALATAASGAQACSNTGGTTGLDATTTCSATLQNTSLNAGDWITLVSGTPGGVAARMSISVTYTIN